MNEANEDALNTLNEILEKQTATMTKIKKGNWKTVLSFLGCTNPVTGGKHNKKRNFNKNIGIKFSLLSRIDFIFVFIDTPNPDNDAMIVDSILDSYEVKEKINDPKVRISKELLAKFLYMVKKSDNAPVLNAEAKQRAKDFYVGLRTLNFNELVSRLGGPVDEIQEEAIAITTRQFQTIIRCATARARLYGKELADVDDVEAAINIVKYMLKTIGYDVNTGKYDANLLLGKPAASEISREKQFFNLLEKMYEASPSGVNKDLFIKELGRESKWKEASRDKIMRTIDQYEQGEYISVLNGMISIVDA
jgi:replicative DNA helicase Mcm